MIKIEFTESEKEALQHQRFNHPHPRVQMKMEAVFLKSQKLSNETICVIMGISGNTLRNYLKDYQEGGIEKLKEIKFNQPKSELEKHRETLEECFRKTPPATINEAVNRIETITGIKRSPTQVRKFLTGMGMRCLKVGAIPAKADPDVQAEYKSQKLEPRLEEAKAGTRAVFL